VITGTVGSPCPSPWGSRPLSNQVGLARLPYGTAAVLQEERQTVEGHVGRDGVLCVGSKELVLLLQEDAEVESTKRPQRRATLDYDCV